MSEDTGTQNLIIQDIELLRPGLMKITASTPEDVAAVDRRSMTWHVRPTEGEPTIVVGGTILVTTTILKNDEAGEASEPV